MEKKKPILQTTRRSKTVVELGMSYSKEQDAIKPTR